VDSVWFELGDISVANATFFLPIFQQSITETYFASPCRFLYDGARISDDDTPSSLDMEDNGVFISVSRCVQLFTVFSCIIDTIDVMVERECSSNIHQASYQYSMSKRGGRVCICLLSLAPHIAFVSAVVYIQVLYYSSPILLSWHLKVKLVYFMTIDPNSISASVPSSKT
jgi:hypothetical protein